MRTSSSIIECVPGGYCHERAVQSCMGSLNGHVTKGPDYRKTLGRNWIMYISYKDMWLAV